MYELNPLKFSLVVAALLGLSTAYAAGMSKADYRAGKEKISTKYKADKAACASQAGNAKDVCIEEAKGKEKVARAELEYAYTGKSADHDKIAVAQAEATYAIAKEKCDDMAGNAKDVCVKEAKAAETKALADAKMSKEIKTSRKDAAQDKREADYKVAIEKCDAMAGDAKDACVAAAKHKYGQD